MSKQNKPNEGFNTRSSQVFHPPRGSLASAITILMGCTSVHTVPVCLTYPSYGVNRSVDGCAAPGGSAMTVPLAGASKGATGDVMKHGLPEYEVPCWLLLTAGIIIVFY